MPVTVQAKEFRPESRECGPDKPVPQKRKKLVRKPGRDWSQPLRRTLQGFFVALNIFLCLQFYLFVRQFESGMGTASVSRPAGVEGWLPIAGMMNLKYFILTGRTPDVHPAAMVLLSAFLLISIVFRKAFCSWLCPVGTLSEALWKAGRKLLRKNWVLPRWMDIPLRSLKYLLLAFFVYAVAGLSAAGINAFLSSPYGLVADVKMLNFFRFMSTTSAITLATLALLSIVYQNFWCRFLCPYGALMGLASLFSPAWIRRNEEACIDCAKCTVACPALLPVDRLVNVRSAECTACLECIAVCPAKGALELALPARRRIPAWGMAAGIAVLFLGIVGYAKWRGAWESQISDSVYRQYVPAASDFQHP
jgi:polyferredoxin